MFSSLAPGGTARADDSNSIVPVSMSNDDQALTCGEPDRHESRFIGRMPWVEDGAGQRVAEDCRRLVERDAMLDEILDGLLGVPLELHTSSYDYSSQLRYRSDKRPNYYSTDRPSYFPVQK